ncbi:hypothetical protein PRIPAC_90267 [Pristionchus pacificus]|uniref:Adipocyte plasma membrane-associated protein n=1 Tax=Pristionchus pacificus TaxID=54126 RepID=A0A8R1YDT2_PRIPA|nr:hypothetical protein PRIPAC_90267 [Pristionchus pacificus]|eukprot:PDM83423.1 hypothetical protein PRIPAC_35055 [Pristionchus pacificus]
MRVSFSLFPFSTSPPSSLLLFFSLINDESFPFSSMIRRRNNINEPHQDYSPYPPSDQLNHRQHQEYVGLILDDDEIQKRLRCCRPSKLKPPAPLTNSLVSNELIGQAIKLLKDEIHGSEGFLIEENVMWVTSIDGRLLRTVNGRIEDSMFLSDKCSVSDRSHCGRPLGIRRLNVSSLLVVDAYLGIISVDFPNKKVSTLLPSSSPIDRLTTLHYIHDVAVVDSDNIVLTERSIKYSPHFRPYERMEHQPNGRLFHYEISRNRITLLLEGLFEPSGIEVAQDRDHIIFAETGTGEVLSYHMRTKGLTKFTENLPGLPSLIRLNQHRDALWVGIEEVRFSETGAPKSLPEYLQEWPFVRKILLSIFPSEIFKAIYRSFAPPHLMAVKYNMQGQPLVSVQGPRGIPNEHRVKSIAQVSENSEGVFLSFSKGNHIAKINKRYVDALQQGIATSARRRG